VTEYRTDEEQLELLKQWWKKNGTFAVSLVVLVLGIYVGGQYYRNYNNSRAQTATQQYAALLELIEQDKTDQAQAIGRRILGEFPTTIQAVSAGLLLAKLAVKQDKPDEAERFLRRVVQEAGMTPVVNLARVRLARILSDQSKFEDALSTLGTVQGPEYAAMAEEIKGDVYVAKGDTEKAKEAYLRSMEAQPFSMRAQQLRMKLEDLGGKSPPPSAG